MVICLTFEYFLISCLCYYLRAALRYRSLLFALCAVLPDLSWLELLPPWGFFESLFSSWLVELPPGPSGTSSPFLWLSVGSIWCSRLRLYSQRSSASKSGCLDYIELSISMAYPTSSTLKDKLCGVCLCEHLSCNIVSEWVKIWGLWRIMLTIMKTICSLRCVIWLKLKAGKCNSL